MKGLFRYKPEPVSFCKADQYLENSDYNDDIQLAKLKPYLLLKLTFKFETNTNTLFHF